MNPVQDTLTEALDRPGVPRVWIHAGDCQGWVLWSVRGGHCQRCDAGPLPVGEYVKPAAAREAAA